MRLNGRHRIVKHWVASFSLEPTCRCSFCTTVPSPFAFGHPCTRTWTHAVHDSSYSVDLRERDEMMTSTVPMNVQPASRSVGERRDVRFMKVQHCQSQGVLNKNAGSGSSGCISVRSCRSAAAAAFRECGASGSASAARTSGPCAISRALARGDPSAVCGGYGRSVFAAVCLAVSRYLATAGLCSAALHTCVEGIRAGRQTGRLSLCRFRKKTSSSAHLVVHHQH